MAYPAAGPVQPAEPAPPARRPGVVATASYLLYAAAAGQVVLVIVTLSQLSATKAAYHVAFAHSQVKGAEDTLVAITAATTVGFGLLLAVGYVVLGILDGRGKNPARIVTWVIAGLSICCSGASLVSSAAGLTSFNSGGTNGAPSAKQIQDAMTAALPGWYQPVLDLIAIVSVLSLLVAVILLALPASNDYFRKPKQPVWQPPVPPVPPPTA